ncbi:SDR family oxidoreductase [Dongia deserti]|uniref:SDR family oxidoreductase n=1 Tax=Dongia deserti TaxID=2268030 RepID=UPI0038993093
MAARPHPAYRDQQHVVHLSHPRKPNLATYALSKGAITQLTSVAAVALAPRNIRAKGIGQGTTLTEMGAK